MRLRLATPQNQLITCTGLDWRAILHIGHRAHRAGSADQTRTQLAMTKPRMLINLLTPATTNADRRPWCEPAQNTWYPSCRNTYAPYPPSVIVLQLVTAHPRAMNKQAHARLFVAHKHIQPTIVR